MLPKFKGTIWGVRENVKLLFCKKSPSGFLFVVFVSLQSAYKNELHSLLMTNLMYPSSQGAKWCQALAFYFNRIKMEFIQLDLTKHIQAYSMSYYTLFNEKTIKKLSCSTYIQNPQKTPFNTLALVPLQLSPCPKLCPMMYVVCTKLNYASALRLILMASMACLINLSNAPFSKFPKKTIDGVFDQFT